MVLRGFREKRFPITSGSARLLTGDDHRSLMLVNLIQLFHQPPVNSVKAPRVIAGATEEIRQY